MSQVLAMRRSRVSAFFPEVIQWIQSRRATGVRLDHSIRAAGAVFRPGAVRYALAEEGIVAYQPAWAESPTGRPRLALVNVALGPRLGTGRTYRDAWRNLRGEVSPAPVGAGAQAVLDEVRRWWLHADSALKRGDLAELGRALSYLRDLLERQR